MGIQASVPMIGPVDDRKLPAKATPVDAGAASRAANLPAPAAAASAKRSDGSDSITYRDVVDTKRPCRADLRMPSAPVAPTDAEARAIVCLRAAAAALSLIHI